MEHNIKEERRDEKKEEVKKGEKRRGEKKGGDDMRKKCEERRTGGQRKLGSVYSHLLCKES